MKNEKALCFRIIVLPDQIESQTGFGLIRGTAEEIERMQRAVDVGRVVSVGDTAFKLERFGNESPIKVGDRIRFKKYATHLFREADEYGKPIGAWYGVLNDDDVLTILED